MYLQVGARSLRVPSTDERGRQRDRRAAVRMRELSLAAASVSVGQQLREGVRVLPIRGRPDVVGAPEFLRPPRPLHVAIGIVAAVAVVDDAAHAPYEARRRAVGHDDRAVEQQRDRIAGWDGNWGEWLSRWVDTPDGAEQLPSTDCRVVCKYSVLFNLAPRNDRLRYSFLFQLCGDEKLQNLREMMLQEDLDRLQGVLDERTLFQRYRLTITN